MIFFHTNTKMIFKNRKSLVVIIFLPQWPPYAGRVVDSDIIVCNSVHFHNICMVFLMINHCLDIFYLSRQTNEVEKCMIGVEIVNKNYGSLLGKSML